MDISNLWRAFFANWPAALSQSGVVVTSTGEQIPFVSFLMSEHLVMLERSAPDTLGARKLVLPFAKIDAIKITEPVGNEVFATAGFWEVCSQPSN